MALNNMGLGFIFSAKDLASSAFGRLERNFMSLDKKVGLGAERIKSAFQQVGVGLSLFGAGAAGMGSALALANAAGEFEQGLASVGAVTRATAEDMAKLRDAAIEAGLVTQFSPAEAIAGLESLATAGQTATQATKTLLPVLDLAAGSLGQLGIAQSAEAVVGTLNAYGLSADNATDVTDRLLRITQLTNFQTRDFEIGLSKAAATGAVFGQELNDVLITMGLLRNRNIDASSSATAFRESVRRVGAESRAQQALTEAGIKIFDNQSGKMRSIVDIMSDFAAATKDMSEEERNHRVVTAFGARGLLAFSSIMNASFTTMRDGEEVTLKGTEAIAAMRKEMSTAGGTANEFREKLLDTFQGQKTLLTGIVQTLAVVLGEPFAQVFKPIVGVIADVMTRLTRLFKDIPGPVKKAFASFAVGVSAVLMIVGGFIAAKASIALLVIGMKALGLSIGGLLSAMWPAVLILGVFAAAVAGFVVAYRRNIGGIADFANRIWEQVKLGFQGLTQLFEQGGFSGAVRDELNQAENRGLKGFLINLFLWGHRIKNFFTGLWEGFSAELAAAEPTIAAVKDAFGSLVKAFGIFSERDDAGTATEKFKSFGDIGAKVGIGLARVFEYAAAFLGIFARIAAGVVSGLGWIWSGVTVLRRAFGQLIDKVKESYAAFFQSNETVNESGEGWQTLGNIVSFVVGFLLSIIGFLVSVITAAFSIVVAAIEIVMGVFSGLADVVTGVVFIIGGIFSGSWDEIWTGMKLIAFGVIDAIIAAVMGLAGAIGGVVDSIAGLFGKKTNFQASIREFKDQMRGDMAKDWGVDKLSFTKVKASPSSAPSGFAQGKQAEVQDRLRTLSAQSQPQALAPMPAVAAMAKPADASWQPSLASPMPPPGPTIIQVKVDEQVLATAVHKAERASAGRSFSPVPSY